MVGGGSCTPKIQCIEVIALDILLPWVWPWIVWHRKFVSAIVLVGWADFWWWGGDRVEIVMVGECWHGDVMYFLFLHGAYEKTHSVRPVLCWVTLQLFADNKGDNKDDWWLKWKCEGLLTTQVMTYDVLLTTHVTTHEVSLTTQVTTLDDLLTTLLYDWKRPR